MTLAAALLAAALLITVALLLSVSLGCLFALLLGIWERGRTPFDADKEYPPHDWKPLP